MDKASVFGTEDCRFESYRGHFIHKVALLDVPLGRPHDSTAPFLRSRDSSVGRASD